MSIFDSARHVAGTTLSFPFFPPVSLLPPPLSMGTRKKQPTGKPRGSPSKGDTVNTAKKKEGKEGSKNTADGAPISRVSTRSRTQPVCFAEGAVDDDELEVMEVDTVMERQAEQATKARIRPTFKPKRKAEDDDDEDFEMIDLDGEDDDDDDDDDDDAGEEEVEEVGREEMVEANAMVNNLLGSEGVSSYFTHF